jgi:hypothetical protein
VTAASLDRAERELTVATSALRRLEHALRQAEDRAQRCSRAVAVAALELVIDQGADAANHVLERSRELDRERQRLDALATFATSMQRSLQLPLALPAQIGRAINPPDPVLTGAHRRPGPGIDWRPVYDAVLRDPDFELELFSAPQLCDCRRHAPPRYCVR